jgi:two-component system CheB/CheR fusion protein
MIGEYVRRKILPPFRYNSFLLKHSTDEPGTAGKFRIVCLGGSAGGLAAYTEILENLPGHTGMAYVIVPHRGPDNPELAKVLGRSTEMEVVDVEDGMPLAPNQVFVMPPGVEMRTSQGLLQLAPNSKPSGWPISLNVFLESLAGSAGRRSVAVIVSGLDHDGSLALKSIKAAGGLTFAQSDPTQPDMPRNAVETGHIDYLLPSVEIAQVLGLLSPLA